MLRIGSLYRCMCTQCVLIVSDNPTTDENKESAQNREHESRTGDHGAKGQPWNARETAPQM